MEGPSKKAKTCPSQERRMVVGHEEETEEERLSREASISSVRVEEVKQVSKGQVDIDVPVDGGRFPSFPPNSHGSSSFATTCREVLKRLPEIMLAAERSDELERQVHESRRKNIELEREKAVLDSRVSNLIRSEKQLKDDFAKKQKEFRSQIWRMERELIEMRSKLDRATQKAKELIEISSTTEDRTQKMK